MYLFISQLYSALYITLWLLHFHYIVLYAVVLYIVLQILPSGLWSSFYCPTSSLFITAFWYPHFRTFALRNFWQDLHNGHCGNGQSKRPWKYWNTGTLILFKLYFNRVLTKRGEKQPENLELLIPESFLKIIPKLQKQRVHWSLELMNPLSFFQATSHSYETVFDNVPEGEEGEAKKETKGSSKVRHQRYKVIADHLELDWMEWI